LSRREGRRIIAGTGFNASEPTRTAPGPDAAYFMEISMRNEVRLTCITTALVALLASGFAEAQWVMVARRAVGRVEQISQSQGGNGASYDSAAVMLEAPVDKVWDAVLRGLRGNTQGVTVTQENAADHVVQFTNGSQIAGIKVSSLGDNLTHLLISSAHTGDQPNAATLVLNSVLRVCKEMSVECSPSK
jgi:hypothetical protein